MFKTADPTFIISFLSAPSFHLLRCGPGSGLPSLTWTWHLCPVGCPYGRIAPFIPLLRSLWDSPVYLVSWGLLVTPSLQTPALWPSPPFSASQSPSLPPPRRAPAAPALSAWPAQRSSAPERTTAGQSCPSLVKVCLSLKACLLQEAFLYHHLPPTPGHGCQLPFNKYSDFWRMLPLPLVTSMSGKDRSDLDLGCLEPAQEGSVRVRWIRRTQSCLRTPRVADRSQLCRAP